MNTSFKILSNTAIQFICRVIQALMGIVTAGILARILGVEGYGNYGLIISYAAFFGAITDLGMIRVLVREIASVIDHKGNRVNNHTISDTNHTPENIIGTSIIINLTFTIGTLLIFSFLLLKTSLLAWTNNYEQIVKIAIVVGLIGEMFNTLRLTEAIFRVKLKAWKVSLITILMSLILLITAVCLKTFNSTSLIWLMIGWALARIIPAITIFLLSIKEGYVWPLKFNWNIAKEVINESLPLGLAVIMGMIYFRIDIIMLRSLVGEAETGLYQAAYRFIDIIITLPGFFIIASTPILVRRFSQEKEKFKNAYDNSLRFLTLASFPIAILFFSLSSFIVQFVYGAEFVEASFILQYLVITFPFIFVAHLYGAILIILKRKFAYLLMTSLGAFINVALNWYLIPKMLGKGAALATIITEIFIFIVTFYLVFTKIKIWPKLNYLWKIGLSSIILLLFLELSSNYLANIMSDTWVNNLFIVIITAITGLTIYALLVLGLKIVTINDIKSIVQRKKA